jgi:hypothetical protein
MKLLIALAILLWLVLVMAVVHAAQHEESYLKERMVVINER